MHLALLGFYHVLYVDRDLYLLAEFPLLALNVCADQCSWAYSFCSVV